MSKISVLEPKISITIHFTDTTHGESGKSKRPRLSGPIQARPARVPDLPPQPHTPEKTRDTHLQQSPAGNRRCADQG